MFCCFCFFISVYLFDNINFNLKSWFQFIYVNAAIGMHVTTHYYYYYYSVKLGGFNWTQDTSSGTIFPPKNIINHLFNSKQRKSCFILMLNINLFQISYSPKKKQCLPAFSCFSIFLLQPLIFYKVIERKTVKNTIIIIDN